MTVSLDYMLTAEQRHAGYSIKFDGVKLRIFRNGQPWRTLDTDSATVQKLRTIVRNDMEMNKVVSKCERELDRDIAENCRDYWKHQQSGAEGNF